MPDINFVNTEDTAWKFTSDVVWGEPALGDVDLGLDDISAFDNVLDVVPSDANDLTESGLIYVGTGGNVKVDSIQLGTVTFLNVPNGKFIKGRVKKVYSTGTTASDMIVIF